MILTPASPSKYYDWAIEYYSLVKALQGKGVTLTGRGATFTTELEGILLSITKAPDGSISNLDAIEGKLMHLYERYEK